MVRSAKIEIKREYIRNLSEKKEQGVLKTILTLYSYCKE